MRYSELIGKLVIDSDGVRIGRIRDLFAERRGDALRVTSILIGEAALLQRITFAMGKQHNHIHQFSPRVIPWTLVDHIEDHTVHLRVPKARALTRGAPHDASEQALGGMAHHQGGGA